MMLAVSGVSRKKEREKKRKIGTKLDAYIYTETA